jgi:serine/threonine protein kinase
LRVLGRGSFGKVLLARRYADQRLYAVKVLEKRAVVRRNETQHIMAERNVLRKNQHHPFLVSLHFSFQTKEKLYFVLDYVNGGEVSFYFFPNQLPTKMNLIQTFLLLIFLFHW